MAYCCRCGQKLNEGANYCSICGGEVPNNTHNARPVQRKKRIWIPITIIVLTIVISIAIIISIIPKSVRLKYEWGTRYSEIEQNEIVLWCDDGYLGNEKRLCCEDPDFKYECTEKLREDEKIYYWIDGDNRLCRMYYILDAEIILSERMNIMTKQYGDEYYVDECGYDDPYFYHYYWWVGDTVIELTNQRVDYYSEEYFMEELTIGKDFYEYFEKNCP